MTRESFRLEFLIAGLNSLYIFTCGIGNSYLNAPSLEKLLTKSGSESRSEKGYDFLIVRALYRLNSSGSAWRAKLEETINSMGYRSTESDPDVWINRTTTENGIAYYKYMLLYVDDVLHLANNAQEDMLKLNQVYRLKEGFGTPDRYIGANVDKVQLEDRKTVWYMTCV